MSLTPSLSLFVLSNPSCSLQVVASEEAALLEQLRSALQSTSDATNLQAVAIMGNLPTGASPDLYAKVIHLACLTLLPLQHLLTR
jgi:fructose-1-phosphate kinase PfkB-like protein